MVMMYSPGQPGFAHSGEEGILPATLSRLSERQQVTPIL